MLANVLTRKGRETGWGLGVTQFLVDSRLRESEVWKGRGLLSLGVMPRERKRSGSNPCVKRFRRRRKIPGFTLGRN